MVSMKIENGHGPLCKVLRNRQGGFLARAEFHDLLESEMHGPLSGSLKQSDIAVEGVNFPMKGLPAGQSQCKGSGIGQKIDDLLPFCVYDKIDNLVDRGIVVEPGSPAKEIGHAFFIGIDSRGKIRQERTRSRE